MTSGLASVPARAVLLLVALLAAGTLAGCGRRGALDSPAAAGSSAVTDPMGAPVVQEPANEPVNDTPFILDAII
ncbi:lipoprotein [Stappia indica]|uniref:lipoprotein n=1 Tax=Stappia indica TaxID=538381 RepID=UPI001CD5B1DD|nr:lipoprotein [Stappia indica]MCA1300304.1 lipoprotein [Stappia indica]